MAVAASAATSLQKIKTQASEVAAAGLQRHGRRFQLQDVGAHPGHERLPKAVPAAGKLVEQRQVVERKRQVIENQVTAGKTEEAASPATRPLPGAAPAE